MLFFGCSNSKKTTNNELEKTSVSSNFLKLIPTDPKYFPTDAQQNECEKLLKSIYPELTVKSQVTKQIEFVDQGENFEALYCNLCGKEMNIELWQEEMEKASVNNFNELSFTTSCCKTKTSLNDLKYEKPAGFSRFIISINGLSEEIGSKDIIKLEKILDTKLKTIWSHI